MKNSVLNILGIISVGISFLLVGIGIDKILNNGLLNWLSKLIFDYQILIAGLLAILAALINSRAILNASILPHQKAHTHFVEEMIDVFTKIKSICESELQYENRTTKEKLVAQKERINSGKIFNMDTESGNHAIQIIRMIDNFDPHDYFEREMKLSGLMNACDKIVERLFYSSNPV